jgi:hypothetical protein
MANVTVVGAQWGDEGKGKIVDWLSNRADVVVRFQGGHNAGHTLVVDGKVYKLALLPSGVVQGKLSVIGNGVVVDPWHLLEEIAKIADQGVAITPDLLVLADNACLILPLHRDLDQAREARAGAGKIGTTGRGIGPAYEDKVGRRAIRFADLADREALDRLLLESAAARERYRRASALHAALARRANCESQDTVVSSFKPRRSSIKRLSAIAALLVLSSVVSFFVLKPKPRAPSLPHSMNSTSRTPKTSSSCGPTMTPVASASSPADQMDSDTLIRVTTITSIKDVLIAYVPIAKALVLWAAFAMSMVILAIVAVFCPSAFGDFAEMVSMVLKLPI